MQHFFPSMRAEPEEQRVQELQRLLTMAIRLSAEKADTADSAERGNPQSGALSRFLGLEDAPAPAPPGNKTATRIWAIPKQAEEYCAALVYSMDRGTYLWGQHPEAPVAWGAAGTSTAFHRITRFGRASNLAEVVATHAEVHGAAAQHKEATILRRRSISGNASDINGTSAGNNKFAADPRWPSPTPTTCPSRRSSGESVVSSLWSTPTGSPANSPTRSPPMSPRRVPSLCFIFDDGSENVDCTLPLVPELQCEKDATATKTPERVRAAAAVWLEVDIDSEWQREQDHKRWWTGALARRRFGVPAIRGASRVDAAAAVGPSKEDVAVFRRRVAEELEQKAALFRDLSALHRDLHPILGYGVEGRTFAVVLQGAPSAVGLRSLPFTPQRSYRILGQACRALLHLHEQQVNHGCLSPESFVVEDGGLGPQLRLAWTPGQKRSESHVYAAQGFRGPGPTASAAGDVWGIACVALVWWSGFDPVPHPWTQFAKSARLQQLINAALTEDPPALPKALLDLHKTAAVSEEPTHTFLSHLASLVTGCLVWDPAERPSAAELLQHRFFEQAL